MELFPLAVVVFCLAACERVLERRVLLSELEDGDSCSGSCCLVDVLELVASVVLVGSKSI